MARHDVWQLGLLRGLPLSAEEQSKTLSARRSMKIRFLITDAYGRGGTIVTTLNMAGALAERGHQLSGLPIQTERSSDGA